MFTSEILHHLQDTYQGKDMKKAYPKDSWIVGHWWLRWLALFWPFLDPQVLDITSTKDYIFVDIVRCWDLII